MLPDFVLNPVFYDVGWDKQLEQKDRGGLEFSQVQSRNDWIVKVKFNQGGDTKYGTGFYVNIPEAKKYVILTAGHNLVDAKGKLSQNLEILQPSGGGLSIMQKDVEIFVSVSYKKTPNHSNAENDYGAILIPKETDSSPPRGFGFALKLGHDNLRKNNMDLSGYRVGSTPGQPVTSTGRCIGCRENQLEYEIQTEKGLSGSPVFMPYKGHETAIAIHNNGPERRGRGSRGTRLNEKVLEEIFGWVKVGYRNKLLMVSNSKGVPPQGLYLRFLPDQEYGWVRLGYEGLETSFDIFPAYAPTPNSANSHLYVFRFQLPLGWPRPKERWVLWDVVRQGVTLTSTLQEFCFPRLIRNLKKNPDEFRIVMAKPGSTMGELIELRMQATDIKEQDIEMGGLDTPEISFEKYLRGKRAEFNDFCFQ